MSDINIGVIGLGYWGPNLLRNFSDIQGARLAGICDIDPNLVQKHSRRYPNALASQDSFDLIKNPEIHAIAIATPIETHFALAKLALLEGKHVFVEKPITRSSAEAFELVALAKEKARLLMVDHVFLYTPAVRKMKSIIESGELGEILYFDSVRINLGLFQHNANVVWDLATHDLAIMDYLFDSFPIAVQAVAVKHMRDSHENIAYIHLEFLNRKIAHFHVNWLAPVKIRKILVGGTRKMVVYDDIEPTEKIKIYDKGVDIRTEPSRIQTLISYRTGDVLAPKLEPTEALHLACYDFVRRIRSGEFEFACDGTHGLRIVSLLETIDRSIRLGGQKIELAPSKVTSVEIHP